MTSRLTKSIGRKTRGKKRPELSKSMVVAGKAERAGSTGSVGLSWHSGVLFSVVCTTECLFTEQHSVIHTNAYPINRTATST
jgi:hypothetical protein